MNGPPLLLRSEMEEETAVRGEGKKKSGGRGSAIAALVFFLLSLILLALLIWTAGRPRPDDFCISSHCISTAASVLKSMNRDVEPCEDFYEYACGQWVMDHPIPDDSPSVSNFEHLGVELEYFLHAKLSQEPNRSLDGEAIVKAKQFYELCTNESFIKDTWRESFDQYVNGLWGWPVINEYPFNPPANFSIEKLYGRLIADYLQSNLFKFSVQPDDKNSAQYVILLDQPDLNLIAREFYVMPEAEVERRAYRGLMTEVFKALEAEPTRAAEAADKILRFESDIANITQPEDDRHDIAEMYTKITLGEMERRFPVLNWTELMVAVFQDIPMSDESPTPFSPRTFDKDTEIVLYGTDYWEKLLTVLPRYPKETVVNYLMWCWFYREMLKELPDPYATFLFQFYNALQMRKVPQLRWHGCIKKTNNLYKWATGRLFILHNFDQEAKNKVNLMIDRIMESFHQILEEEDWLSPETKEVARGKIAAIERKVGYPDFLHDVSRVDNLYRNYVVYEGNYYKSKFQAVQMETRHQLERLGSHINRTRWASGAAVVNAFYSPNTNEIIIPAGILRPVFWSKHYPWSMNFGGIGVVIGHEITHGFDDRGRLYDKMGNIREWWDNKTIENFEAKAKCIEDQYSEYGLPQVDMKVSGKRTKGENIADNGGLKQAYDAFKQWEKENGAPEQLLPGLGLNHDQLFFLNYAQIWCGSMRDKEAVRKLKAAVHSPGPVRVMGPLSNSPEFAEAFHCPVGSPMNPESKCRVW